MTQTLPLHELLYVSTLAPGAPLSVVADIARQARVANKLFDITGLLVFDGERFGQYLEGGMKAVSTLFESISRDKRHVNVNLLHQGSCTQRRFTFFDMGFSNVDGADLLESLEGFEGAQAVKAFMSLTDDFEMSS